MSENRGPAVSHYRPLEWSMDPNAGSELAQRAWAEPVAADASHRATKRPCVNRVRLALDGFDPGIVHE